MSDWTTRSSATWPPAGFTAAEMASMLGVAEAAVSRRLLRMN